MIVLNENKSNGFVFVSAIKKKPPPPSPEEYFNEKSPPPSNEEQNDAEKFDSIWIRQNVLYYHMGWLWYLPDCERTDLLIDGIEEEKSLLENNSCQFRFDRQLSFLNTLVQCYIESEEYQKAIPVLTELIELIPKTPISAFSNKHIQPPVSLYFERAKCKQYLNDYRGALNDCDKSILLDNRNDVVFLLRGLLK